MLRSILEKSYKQHTTKQELYDHIHPISKILKGRRTRHAGHCLKEQGTLHVDVLRWPNSLSWSTLSKHMVTLEYLSRIKGDSESQVNPVGLCNLMIMIYKNISYKSDAFGGSSKIYHLFGPMKEGWRGKPETRMWKLLGWSDSKNSQQNFRGRDTYSHLKMEHCYWEKRWLCWEIGMWFTEDQLHFDEWYMFLRWSLFLY